MEILQNICLIFLQRITKDSETIQSLKCLFKPILSQLLVTVLGIYLLRVLYCNWYCNQKCVGMVFCPYKWCRQEMPTGNWLFILPPLSGGQKHKLDPDSKHPLEISLIQFLIKFHNLVLMLLPQAARKLLPFINI